MATAKVTLKHGFTVGERLLLDAELREPSVGDILDATEESEKVVLTANGPQLVISPTLVGIHTLRRQIVRIGDYPGPLSLIEMRRLHRDDLNQLQLEAEALDLASLAVDQRGRTDGGEGRP